ncbi:MAG: glycosyltransferase family 2 protein [Eubacteriales bacterium]|nr:glycosyltransferase family 2 protein [Eubacteriales bacterium]
MKVSLITITYNSKKTIDATILSIIKQSYPDIEYIIVDGGSTDGTLMILDNYRSHITTLISEPDNGISDAFNKGIKAATGDIIGIVNSDDFLNREAISTLMEIVEKEGDFDVYYGNSIMFSETGAYTYKPGADLSNLPLYMILSHPATFIKRDAYKKYGGYSLEHKCAMDFELISKMYMKGAKFKYIDATLSCFRLGGVSKKKSLLTEKESCEIAVRNGVSRIKSKTWYLKVRLKSYLLDFFGKCGVEMLLRSFVKKQSQKNTIEIRWFLKE